MPRTPRTLALAALLPLLAASGCCTVSRYFCGPDDSRWVQESYATPTATIATLREAFRRDDTIVVHRCLGEDFKRRAGVDAMGAAVAIERLKEEHPGLHLVGYAEVTPLDGAGRDHAAYRLDVAGRAFRIDLVRQAYWDFAYLEADTDGRVDPDSVLYDGAYFPRLDDVGRHVTLHDDGLQVRATLSLPPSDFASDVAVGELSRVGIGFDWKVDGFEPLDDA